MSDRATPDVTPAGSLEVPPRFQRGDHSTRDEWIESGVFAVGLLKRTMGRDDLAGVSVLDVGCGTKVVKTLLDGSEPIGRYVGIDATAEIIDWLRRNVSDPRFEFHHLDAHNEMYNPRGLQLASFDRLPVGHERFDLICLFSVFTHLAPHDFTAMLRLLRRHAKPETMLLFSLNLRWLPEHQADAKPAMDPQRETYLTRVIEAGLASDDLEIRQRTEDAIARALRRAASLYPEPFVDEDPERPLAIASYREDYALDLVRDAGWEPLEVCRPERYIAHRIVCRPAAK